MFDALTDKLQCDCYILNDLLLNLNDSKFQIDTLIKKKNRAPRCPAYLNDVLPKAYLLFQDLQ